MTIREARKYIYELHLSVFGSKPGLHVITARTQVSLFGLGFWLVSALITLVGAGAVVSKAVSDQEVVLQRSSQRLDLVTK